MFCFHEVVDSNPDSTSGSPSVSCRTSLGILAWAAELVHWAMLLAESFLLYWERLSTCEDDRAYHNVDSLVVIHSFKWSHVVKNQELVELTCKQGVTVIVTGLMSSLYIYRTNETHPCRVTYASTLGECHKHRPMNKWSCGHSPQSLVSAAYGGQHCRWDNESLKIAQISSATVSCSRRMLICQYSSKNASSVGWKMPVENSIEGLGSSVSY